jgi:hypothetical protein
MQIIGGNTFRYAKAFQKCIFQTQVIVRKKEMLIENQEGKHSRGHMALLLIVTYGYNPSILCVFLTPQVV